MGSSAPLIHPRAPLFYGLIWERGELDRGAEPTQHLGTTFWAQGHNTGNVPYSPTSPRLRALESKLQTKNRKKRKENQKNKQQALSCQEASQLHLLGRWQPPHYVFQ